MQSLRSHLALVMRCVRGEVFVCNIVNGAYAEKREALPNLNTIVRGSAEVQTC